MKCLVVCDSQPMTQMIEEYTERLKCFSHLKTVGEFNLAIQALNKYAFDYIILILSHPKEANLDLLQFVRTESISAEVIMISSVSRVEYIRKAFSFGICDYIIKPVSFDRFKQSIRRATTKANYLDGFKYLSQSEVDHYIALGDGSGPIDLTEKKGVSALTLKKIEAMISKESRPFTAGALAKKAGLSRITVRRYLENMLEEGLLSADYIYGEIGRPQKVYFKPNENKEEF